MGGVEVTGINYLQMIMDINVCLQELTDKFKSMLDIVEFTGEPTVEKLSSHHFAFSIDGEEKFRISLQGRGIRVKEYLPIMFEEISRLKETTK
jgi:hypothetical protein